MAYSYVVTSQKTTAVNHSLICQFTSSEDTNLILSKGSHLEVHSFREEGLVAQFDLTLYGNILSIDKFRPATSTKDVIFVLTDKKHFSVLSYDLKNNKVITDAVGNVKDRVGREAECGQRGFVDPDNRMLAMILYDGLLKIVPNDASGLKEAFNVPLDEIRVIDIKFLHGCARPTLCMLYEDNRRGRHIKTLAVDIREKELVSGPWNQNNVEFSATMLIPVPLPLGGVILVGAMSLTYISGTGNIQSVGIQLAQISAYTPINVDGSRYLLGDHKGNLFVLVLCVDAASQRVTSLVVDTLGVTSVPKTLNYLDNGVVFVGSAFGDSQLIKLHPPRQTSASSSSSYADNCFDVLDTYVNVGPIVDMCLVDSDKQGGSGGQRQLVTCSGAYKDGSLRIVRSGIGILEQASLDLDGIKGVWSLRPNENSAFDKYLVQSFVGETRILCIEDEELAETEFEGFSQQEPTLYCGNTAGGTMVQVTARSVCLVDSTSFALLDEHTPSRSITVASGNLIQIAIAVSGGELQCLEVVDRRLALVASKVLDQDVACLSLRPLGQTPAASSAEDSMDVDSSESGLRASIIAIGMWTDNSARLLALPTLDELCRVSLGTDTQVRDILAVQLGDKAFLMIGVGDGHLITYSVEMNAAQGGLPVLANKRKGALGTHSISFSCFLNANELCVFASCDRPTVIYCRNGKLLFSAVNSTKGEIVGMTPFHSELFPSCLAMVSEGALVIGTIEDIQKIHIQTVPLGEAPRRIVHNQSAGVYAVLTEKTASTERGDETVSRVLFLEEGTMEVFGSFELDRLEQGISCVAGVFNVLGAASSEGVIEYIIVGTARVVNEEIEPSRGRILVFEVTADRRINLVIERETSAAVFSLAMLQGRLAAGLGSRVQLYSLVTPDTGGNFPGQPELAPGSSHPGFIMCLFLKAHGDRLLVGDMVRSMSVLQLRDGQLEEVGRDFNTNYMLAVEVQEPGGDHFLGCDDYGNLFSIFQQADAITDEERCRLETSAEFGLGDFVNVFRRGSLVGQPIESGEASSSSGAAHGGERQDAKKFLLGKGGALNSSIMESNYLSVTGYPPTTDAVLYGTVGGAIGSVITLSEDSYRFFNAVERAMVLLNNPLGGLTHAEWRGFSNSIRSGPQRNAVDGDLVETFLDLSAEELEIVTRDVNDSLNNYLQSLASHDNNKGSASGAVNTESVGPLLHNLTAVKVQLSVEDVVRRVEDMARLH